MRLAIWNAIRRSASTFAHALDPHAKARTADSRIGAPGQPRRARFPILSPRSQALDRSVRSRRIDIGRSRERDGAGIAHPRTASDGPAPFGAKAHATGGSLHPAGAEIRAGLEQGQFVPHYQPIVALASGDLIGFESLARWEHPARGLVAPEGFIGQAEDSGLIHELSLALLERACRDMRGWPAHLTLSINLSPLQLQRGWVAPAILRTLGSHGIAPGRLIVELTESRDIHDFGHAREVLESLRLAGVQVALDDFGIGYSSLARLRELKFDRVKIDRAFTSDLARHENRAIVRAMLGLGAALGATVVAEGVETASTAARLAELGCGYAQGFLYSPPVPAAAALAFASAAMPSQLSRDPFGVCARRPAVPVLDMDMTGLSYSPVAISRHH